MTGAPWHDPRNPGGRVEVCPELIGDTSCTRVVIENAKHKRIAAATADESGVALLEDLPQGEYLVQVLRRDGTVAEQMVQHEGALGLGGRALAQAKMDLPDSGEISWDVHVTQSEAGLLRRCARIEGAVESHCSGYAMASEDTEWAWFVRLENLTDPGSGELTRPFKTAHGNEFSFPRVLPGDWQLFFIEMDLPSYEQKNNPDYHALVKGYATGRKVPGPAFTVSPSDTDSMMALGVSSLEYERCQ